ncbi:MAG: hypothetical protein KDI44_19155 [Thiothrix sp.]|nr:hypothetical protein [Thiothrix sp.]HPQ94806.1 hypothetical protein [Thiolinea sp.]
MNTCFERTAGTTALSLLLAGVLAAPVPVMAGGAIVGATEMTQLMNNAELVGILGQEAQQLLQLVESYQLMLKEATLLPDFMQRNAINALMDLARSTQAGMAISYAHATVADDLKAAYFDFRQYEGWLETATPAQRASRYQQVLETTYDTVTAALETAGLQAGMFEDEADAVARMQEQMRTASGQNQILQAAGSIAAAQIEQTQKLRQLLLNQTNLQATEAAAAADERARGEAALERSKRRSLYLDPDNERPFTASDILPGSH